MASQLESETFENEEMSNSQRQGVITMIEKRGKDRTLGDPFLLLMWMQKLSLK